MRDNQKRIRRAAAEPPPQACSPAPTGAGMSYVVPTEFVELPSRGQFYSEGHPLFQQETIEIKFMTAKDEDILSSTALIKNGLVIDRLLESLMVQDIDPKTLLVGDRSAIMIAARISSYGPSYKASVDCPSCETDVEYIFDLKKTNLIQNCFDNKFLKKNSIEHDVDGAHFSITLPVSKVRIGLRPLDGDDEKLLGDIDEDQLITSTLSLFISSVNDSTDTDTIGTFIDNMPAADSKHVRGIYPDLVPTINLKQEFVCENCLHHTDMEVPLSAEFFWPG